MEGTYDEAKNTKIDHERKEIGKIVSNIFKQLGLVKNSS